MEKKIAILGCGNLGLSIVKGLTSNGKFKPANIVVTRRHLDKVAELENSGIKVTNDNAEAVKQSELIIIAVKPYNVVDLVDEIKEALDISKHVLVSVATGVKIQTIKDRCNKDIGVYRVMPNTATDVRESVSLIASDETASKNIEIVKRLFNELGITIEIDEELMEAATILGACGIAYVMRFIRAMVQGGIEIGFDAKTASQIVNQTVKGAAALLIERGEHPEFEIDKVTTPRGCTIVGLNEMEHNGFSSSLIRGIVTSFKKIDNS